MTDIVTCPNCRYRFEASGALAAQVREQLREELNTEATRKESELRALEAELHRRELTFEACRQQLEDEVANRVAQERARIVDDANAKAQESASLAIRDLQDQLRIANAKLGDAQREELELRRERRELEAAKRELELSVSRRLDEERRTIRDDAKREAVEEYRLKEADTDKLITDLRRQIGDLKRRSEQGSQQAQGEVMELELEELLGHHFPFDTIEPVPVGAHGGDVVQHVRDADGKRCGTILWESKRTKAWNDSWLPKLRDDQRVAKAHVAVLLTAEMPKAFSTFGCIDETWVTSRSCAVGLAAALRAGLIEVARTRRAEEGRQTKLELMYQYLSSREFRQRVEGIAEAFITMRDDLEAEKRALNRLWAKREKQLQRAVVHTAGLYGDVSGIVGGNLPQIPNLEFDADSEIERLIVQHDLQGADSPF